MLNRNSLIFVNISLCVYALGHLRNKIKNKSISKTKNIIRILRDEQMSFRERLNLSVEVADLTLSGSSLHKLAAAD